MIAEGGETLAPLADELDATLLSDTAMLVRTGETQSRLYHFVKRRLSPERLFVGRLADHPKFKGMKAGALKWLRAGD